MTKLDSRCSRLISDLGVKKRDYNGLSIFELASFPCSHATVCSGDEHQKWTGTFTIDRTENSYRYGNEIQFVVWSTEAPKLKMERASNGGFYRVEICIPQEQAVRLLETALNRIYNAENMKLKDLPEITVSNLADIM